MLVVKPSVESQLHTAEQIYWLDNAAFVFDDRMYIIAYISLKESPHISVGFGQGMLKLNGPL